MKQKKFFRRVTAVVLVGVVAASIFVLYQMQLYNESVLDIYAQQQDAYVKLVLDQINLEKDREDDELISDILSSLNTSDEKYWTLTKDGEFLYVKDVAETNRYKGFTPDSYYLSESGKEFVGNLQTDRVTHDIIDMDGDRYVASGTQFSYMGGTYKICLLTYDGVILDSNSFLQARITMYIVVFALLLLFLVVSMLFSQALDRRIHTVEILQERVRGQNVTIEGLEDRLVIEASYNASDSIFHEKVIETFLEKLEKREIRPLRLVAVKPSEGLDRAGLIKRIDRLTGKKYLKFSTKEGAFLLLYPQTADDVAEKLRNDPEIGFLDGCVIKDDYDSYVGQYEKFRKKVLPDG